MSATRRLRFPPRGAARSLAAGLALTAAMAGATGCAPGAQNLARGDPSAPAAPAHADRGAQLLSRLRVIESLPDVPGYDRSCQTSQGVKRGCVFGPAWSDDTTAPDGHNGCDSRTDSIAAAARELQRTGRCKIASGVLDDPYTGRTVPFTAATIALLQIDHLVSVPVIVGDWCFRWSSRRQHTAEGCPPRHRPAVTGWIPPPD